MGKQDDLDGQVNSVVDVVLLRFQKRNDVDPKIKLLLHLSKKEIFILCNLFQFHKQHHH
jgi:hypothetical protein